MRIINIISIILILICCNSRQLEYNKINSNENISYKYDSRGNILDTLPSYIRLIKKYSVDNFDTTKILLSDPRSALNFARRVLDSTYGIKRMISEKPFNITLIDNKFWYISGTMPKHYIIGGAAEILISKYNGEILFLSHGK
jgi:hypothetical protein